MPHRRSELTRDHTPQAIARRIQQATTHSLIGDIVLGAVDGAVTTFAIVAGVAGANLSTTVAIVLGVANLLADGFSMAASNYLKAHADRQVIDRYRRMEEEHIRIIPDGEREEVRQIFAAKGFEGETLDEVVRVITDDHQRWVDTMLTEEWGLPLETPPPLRAGLATFLAFLAAGLIPLLPLFLGTLLSAEQKFLASAACTAIAFFSIGMFRGKVVQQPLLIAGIETLAIGGGAATLAYLVGALLRGMIGE